LIFLADYYWTLQTDHESAVGLAPTMCQVPEIQAQSNTGPKFEKIAMYDAPDAEYASLCFYVHVVIFS
jgi:hypothetical protein